MIPESIPTRPRGLSRTPTVTKRRVVPVAGRDSMLLNRSGAHGPFFTRNLVVLTDSNGATGLGEVPGGAGIRGFSQAPRAASFGRIPDYHARCASEIFVAAQIESRRAPDNLEEIAAVEGIDGVSIGPGDLSTSLGFLGQQNHPEVVAVIEAAIARIRRAGKHGGILTANEELAGRYIAADTRFTAVGSDMGGLARSSEALAARFRKPA